VGSGSDEESFPPVAHRVQCPVAMLPLRWFLLGHKSLFAPLKRFMRPKPHPGAKLRLGCRPETALSVKHWTNGLVTRLVCSGALRCILFVKIFGVSALCHRGCRLRRFHLLGNTGAHSIVSRCERVFSGVERKK
jgi:hypothetical protein